MDGTWTPPTPDQQNGIGLDYHYQSGVTILTFKYYAFYRNGKDNYNIRVKMVRYAKEHGNKPTAWEFATAMKTVHKWVQRFQDGGKSALQDRSRRPLNSPAEIKPYWKFKILGICK